MPIARFKRALSVRLGARGGIVHSVGTLVGGTAFAQALTILALPVLTRLYSPADFAALAVYASVLGILSVVACLRLEIAIPLPEDDREAINLFALSLGCGLSFSALIGLLVLALGDHLVEWLRIPTLAPYLWMVPLGVAIASAYASTQYWSTRKKKFSRIAKTRMVQALGGVGTQVGAGAAGIGPFGLLFGHMISTGAGFVGLARDAMKHERHLMTAVSLSNMRRILGQYSRFPKYSTLEALSSTAGTQLPVILIAALALGPEAGFLMLATRVMGAPMGLVGGSLAQVYLSHAPEELRAGRLGEFTAKVLVGLLRTGVGPLIFIGIVAGPMSGVLLGSGWGRVGELVAWMTPWFILQFLASPVSMVMHVTGRQGQLLALTLFGFGSRVGAIWLSYILDKEMLAESYAVAGAIFYFICAVMFYRSAGVGSSSAFHSVRQALVSIATWSLLGFGVSLFTKMVLEL